MEHQRKERLGLIRFGLIPMYCITVKTDSGRLKAQRVDWSNLFLDASRGVCILEIQVWVPIGFNNN